MKYSVLLAALMICSISRADIYNCAAEFGKNKGTFAMDTDTQDKASIEIAGGLDVGCAVYRPHKILVCSFGQAPAATISAVADLGTSVISVGFVDPNGVSQLTCHRQQ